MSEKSSYIYNINEKENMNTHGHFCKLPSRELDILILLPGLHSGIDACVGCNLEIWQDPKCNATASAQRVAGKTKWYIGNQWKFWCHILHWRIQCVPHPDKMLVLGLLSQVSCYVQPQQAGVTFTQERLLLFDPWRENLGEPMTLLTQH